MSEIDMEYYESLDRYHKSAYTKKLKYGDDAHAKWGAKGGSAQVPKGFAMHADKVSKMQKARHAKNREIRDAGV